MRQGLIFFLILAMFMPALAPVSADGSWTVDLYAGQTTLIGHIAITQSGDVITATYNITVAGWCVGTTHLYVGSQAPTTSAPGQFPHQHPRSDCVQTDTYTVSGMGGNVYVAAHAEAKYFAQAGGGNTITSTTSFTATEGGSDSYVDIYLSNGMSGQYNGWCVDPTPQLQLQRTYTANVVPVNSGSFSTHLVARSENLDVVNYIINQNYTAQGYAMADVQLAIWSLVDTVTPDFLYAHANVPYEAYDQVMARANAIVTAAQASGEGFSPTCGQKMAVILEPLEDNAQHLIAEYAVPCGDNTGGNRSETAWAIASDGYRFEQGWGAYFQLISANTASQPATTTQTTAAQPTGGDSVQVAPPVASGGGTAALPQYDETLGGLSAPPPAAPLVYVEPVTRQPWEADGSLIHTVQANETLFTIAGAYSSLYGVTREGLVAVNQQYNGWRFEPEFIKAGEKIMILPPNSLDPATGEVLNNPYSH